MISQMKLYHALLFCVFKRASAVSGLIFILLCSSCTKEEENVKSPIAKEKIEKLSQAKSFGDIFVLEDSLQLEANPQSLITFLGVVAVDSKGRITVSDMRRDQILMFSDRGQFLKQIATKGSGPGEVLRPYGLAFARDGNMVAADIGNNRINIYDEKRNFKRSFLSEYPSPMRVMIDSRGNIFVQVPSMPGGKPIQKYDQNGKLVEEFGYVPEIGRKIGMNISGGSFTKYNNRYIYYVHPTEYAIQQFNLNGQRIRIIKHQSRLYRPLQVALTSSDPQSRAKWRQSWDIVHTVIVTNDGFLLVVYQFTQDSLDNVTNVVDLYDTEGNFIVGDVRTSYLPVCVDDQDRIYCLNQDLRFIQENPILFRFKIRT